MSNLVDGVCIPCEQGGEPMTTEQISNYLPQTPTWEVLNTDKVLKLYKKYEFKNFKEALDFLVKVGDIAEKNGHHPVMSISWGYVEVYWWTHAVKGLHRNDFIMASKTDAQYKT